ncbi:unnamed protein product [Cylindrotheca closterium]|uniref:ShKT domain-containing protein n=1 Tax=Cylindrotheca closterium TaxID=2856 RepID=A0AAD2FF12_9STRA|nr:unnamed protein product [Cylindrotheca closterium]
MKITSLLWLCAFTLPQYVCSETEEERIAARLERGYQWPPSDSDYKPNTPGWKKLFEHRLRQVEEMEDKSSRFEAYVQTLSASIVQPNFTEHGFGLARAPDDLMDALRQGIYDGLKAGPREEAHYPAIAGKRPWFIDRPDLMTRVLKELQHFPEAWSNMELTPEIAYGFRLYRNQSNLYMHVDKPETHVISFILHIDSSEDAEPWPILIEDYHGTTHEVILKSGDMLFYESSKCFHGRPHTFHGSWYSSVFVHYYPKYGYKETFNDREKVWALPNHWQDDPKTHHEAPIVMHGTTFEEPSCPNGWCQTKWTKKWSGPGKDGYWIAPSGESFLFQPKQQACEDYSEKCSEWVAWDTNECNRNSDYMLIHCKKSCNVCSDNSEAEL